MIFQDYETILVSSGTIILTFITDVRVTVKSVQIWKLEDSSDEETYLQLTSGG